MSLERTGDWNKVRHLVDNLQDEMEKAKQIALKRWGLLAESIAVTHISKQDLGWVPLQPGTISSKVRLGYSENILVRTSTYFQSITSYVKKDTAYAGVKKQVRYKNGQNVADIAAVHEFGSESANIPARPLWKPTMIETYERIGKESKFNPTFIFLKRIKKYL